MDGLGVLLLLCSTASSVSAPLQDDFTSSRHQQDSVRTGLFLRRSAYDTRSTIWSANGNLVQRAMQASPSLRREGIDGRENAPACLRSPSHAKGRPSSLAIQLLMLVRHDAVKSRDLP